MIYIMIQFIKSLFTHNLIFALVYRQVVCSTIHIGSCVYTSCVLDDSLLLQRGHKLCPRSFIFGVVVWTQVVYSSISLALACTQVVYSTIHYCSSVDTSCVLDHSFQLQQRGHKLCTQLLIFDLAWTQVVYSTNYLNCCIVDTSCVLDLPFLLQRGHKLCTRLFI